MRAFVVVAVVVGLVLAACASPPARTDVAEHTVDPSFVHGTDHGDTDRLAATVATDAQRYWAQAYPATFGAPWRDLDGGFFSIDTAGTGSSPPCASNVSEVEGNAYYCQSVDAIVWDRAALLPVLREHYGDTAVAVVLAHEIGHAVQQRAGVGSGDPLHLESMADCFAGSFLRWVADARAPHLRTNPGQLDSALRAITVFRDPVGSGGLHGTAFDRVSAFQLGFTGGPGGCPSVSEPRIGAQGHGDRKVPMLTAADPTAAEQYFGSMVARRGGRWTSPQPGSCVGQPGPVSYCDAPPRVSFDRAALTSIHDENGDQAVSTLVASRYATAALTQLGKPVSGTAISCLTGAFTAAQPGLSAGDLDEAVQEVLASDAISRDGSGRNSTSGFDRLAAFRSGVLGGSSACG